MRISNRTLVDPSNGLRNVDKSSQLLTNLAKMEGRVQNVPGDGKKAVFGMNGVQTDGIGGTLSVGDEVELIWKD